MKLTATAVRFGDTFLLASFLSLLISLSPSAKGNVNAADVLLDWRVEPVHENCCADLLKQ